MRGYDRFLDERIRRTGSSGAMPVILDRSDLLSLGCCLPGEWLVQMRDPLPEDPPKLDDQDWVGMGQFHAWLFRFVSQRSP
jgi:hypothetical protein